MLKIEYPKVGSPESVKFIGDYQSVFSSGIDEMQRRLDIILKDPRFSKVTVKKVDEILVLDFESLIKLNKSFLSCNPAQKEFEEVQRIFKYDGKGAGSQQRRIAKFFVKNKELLNIHTCYFCNLEYINPFVDVADYHDVYDFIQTAPRSDLNKIFHIVDRDTKKIVELRNLYSGVELLLKIKEALTPFKFENLENMNFNDSKFHFTLDHVLSKDKNPLSALSLFNLVPSCYSCNSKFKGEHKLVTSIKDSILSPTCNKFDFSSKNKFIVGFSNPLVDYSLVKDIKDFTIKLHIPNKTKGYGKYETVFKLNARYKEHKEDILDLISKKEKYPTSHIRTIARLTKTPFDDVKKSIFGEELSLRSSELNRKPKAKLKVDIARQLKI